MPRSLLLPGKLPDASGSAGLSPPASRVASTSTTSAPSLKEGLGSPPCLLLCSHTGPKCHTRPGTGAIWKSPCVRAQGTPLGAEKLSCSHGEELKHNHLPLPNRTGREWAHRGGEGALQRPRPPPRAEEENTYQHPTYFKLHNSMQSGGQAESRQGSSREPPASGPGLSPSQGSSSISGQRHPQATLRAGPLPMGSPDSNKGHHGLSPSFSAVKSLLSLAKMGRLSRHSLSLEGRSLLRAGTGLGVVAAAVPWSYTHLTTHRREAGKRGLEPLLCGC